LAKEFDFDAYKVDPAVADRIAAKQTANSKSKKAWLSRSTEPFSRVLREHASALDKADVRSFAVWRLLVEIAWLNLENKGERFKLSNKAAKKIGLSHASKTRALQILAELKIIHLEGAIRKSPWITPLM
jgi:hypothetical protein